MAGIVVETARAEQPVQAAQPGVRDNDNGHTFAQSLRDNGVDDSSRGTTDSPTNDSATTNNAPHKTNGADAQAQSGAVKSDAVSGDAAATTKTDATTVLGSETDKDVAAAALAPASLKIAVGQEELGKLIGPNGLRVRQKDEPAGKTKDIHSGAAKKPGTEKTSTTSPVNETTPTDAAGLLSATTAAGTIVPAAAKSADAGEDAVDAPVAIAAKGEIKATSTETTQRVTNAAGPGTDRAKKMPDDTGGVSPAQVAELEPFKNAGEISLDRSTASSAASKTEIEAGIGAIAMGLHGGAGSAGEGAATHHGGDTAGHIAVTGSQGNATEMASTSDSRDGIYGSRSGFGGEAGPGLLTATPSALEVGLANGSHGWLKIRTEMADGVVTASLSAGTAAGNEMLHRELPALTNFLQEEKVGLSALVVKHTPATDTGGYGAGSDAQRQSGTGQQSLSRGNGEGPSGSTEGVWNHADYESWSGLTGASGFIPAMRDGNGNWLNVRV